MSNKKPNTVVQKFYRILKEIRTSENQEWLSRNFTVKAIIQVFKTLYNIQIFEILNYSIYKNLVVAQWLERLIGNGSENLQMIVLLFCNYLVKPII